MRPWSWQHIDFGRFLYPAILTLLILLAWQVSVVVFRVPKIILPLPFDVVASVGANAANLSRNTLSTGLRILIAFAGGAIIALPLAVLVVEMPLVGRLVQPLITLSQAIPKVALAPVVVVWFGHGIFSQILFAALIAFFPIFIEAVVGLRSTNREMILLAQSMGATRLQTLLKFRLPGALPHIFAGLKVGMTLAVVGGVVAEWIGGSDGVALMLLEADSLLDTPLAISAIIILSVLGMLFYLVVALFERLCMPWQRAAKPLTTAV